MRVRQTAAQIVSSFQLVRAQVRWHICTHLHCYRIFQYRDKMGFQSHIHFTKGQCSKGDTESFRHERLKRGEWTTKAALSPEPRIEKMDKSSRRKSPCGRSSSGKLTRKTCQHDVHGKYTKPSCDFWRPPKCQYYKKQSGYRFGENVLSCTSRLKDSPPESRKSQVIKVLLLYLRIHDNWGCVSRDVEPPKFNSISRKSTTVLRPIHTVHFSKNTQRHTNIREIKGPSLGVIQRTSPHKRSPYAPKFQDRSLEETERQERCTRGDARVKARSKGQR